MASNSSRVLTRAYLNPAHTAKKKPCGTHAMSRSHSYNVVFKLNVVECAGKKSKETAAREFGMPTKSIRVWYSQKDVLVALRRAEKRRTISRKVSLYSNMVGYHSTTHQLFVAFFSTTLLFN